MLKKFLIGFVAVFVLLVVIGAIAGGGDSSDSSSSSDTPTATQTTESSTPAVQAPKAKHTKAAPSMSVSQENAVKSAESYLSLEAFSRRGLIQQLSSKAGEGFPRKDAVFAVNHIDVNWKQEAAKSAKSYLSMQSFSRSGLIQQLESSYGEGFTHAQAVYGVNKAGL